MSVCSALCCFSVLFAFYTCTSILICGASCFRSAGYFKKGTSIPLQPTRMVFHFTAIQSSSIVMSAFRPRGVPGPTSKLSPRTPAQMGRREMEHEGGKETGKRGKPAASVLSCAQVGCTCSRGLQASAWERAGDLRVGPFSRTANLLVESPGPSFYRRKERVQVYNGV